MACVLDKNHVVPSPHHIILENFPLFFSRNVVLSGARSVYKLVKEKFSSQFSLIRFRDKSGGRWSLCRIIRTLLKLCENFLKLYLFCRLTSKILFLRKKLLVNCSFRYKNRKKTFFQPVEFYLLVNLENFMRALSRWKIYTSKL